VRTTITIDDSLWDKAAALAAPGLDKSELLRECVKAYIEVQAARRLAALGGKAPEIELAPRRRSEPPSSGPVAR
jgi:putative antitoxin of VapBC-like toxin-antitoxin system